MAYSPKGRNLNIVKQFANMRMQAERSMRYSGLPNSCLRATIYDVDDPENLGRVRVLFDDFNAEVPEVQNAGEASKERIADGEPQLSHWINTSPAFKGKQPKGLVGKRVNISVSNGQYQYAVLNDVLYDPELLTEKAQKNYRMPNNSSMTRLPVYDSDEIPDPSEENIGCLIVENNGPMNGDWVCVCVKRDGKYYWVRLSDLAHGHAGGNDGTQQVDSMGNRQNPVMMGTVSDNVFPTTHQQMVINSAYTTKPQGNPKGETAHWYPAPKSNATYVPGSNFSLLNPQPDIALQAVRSPAGYPGLTDSIQGFAPSFNPEISTVLEPKAVEALKKAQEIAEKVASTLRTAQGVINDPVGAATQFVAKEALSVAAGSDESGIPPGTEVALADIKNPKGTLPTSLPSPSNKSIPSQILNVFKKVIGFG